MKSNISHHRTYRTVTYKEAVLRICCDKYESVVNCIVEERDKLDEYIMRHPEFKDSFEPLELLTNAPHCARKMARAAHSTGVGPMAAVAGTMAQLAAETGVKAGAKEAIVENGGDVYIYAQAPVVIGIHTGSAKIGDQLAFSLSAQDLPISICASSGKMGHSASLGKCDLAVAFSKDASLADAAATLAANLVKNTSDMESALARISAIQGIQGVLIVLKDKVGLAGKLPPMVKNSTPDMLFP